MKIAELRLALEREQSEAGERIHRLEDMAEREKQRILKHLEDEKRFTRDIIDKSETMIVQLKTELSSERQRKTEEQKTHDALRDIYKKLSPRQGKIAAKLLQGDHDDDDDDVDEEDQFDGETTVYHKDDPWLASTPRDGSDVGDKSNYHTLQRQLHDQFSKDAEDSSDELLLNSRKDLFHSPTTKRASNTQHSSMEKLQPLGKCSPESPRRIVRCV